MGPTVAYLEDDALLVYCSRPQRIDRLDVAVTASRYSRGHRRHAGREFDPTFSRRAAVAFVNPCTALNGGWALLESTTQLQRALYQTQQIQGWLRLGGRS